jgi:hypothetical protein
VKYFKITAENVQGVNSLVKELERARYTVVLHDKDPVFNSMTRMLVKTQRCTVANAENLIWDYNNGAYCKAEELSEEEFYDMCDF